MLIERRSTVAQIAAYVNEHLQSTHTDPWPLLKVPTVGTWSSELGEATSNGAAVWLLMLSLTLCAQSGASLTWDKDNSRMHYVKQASRWSPCNSLACRTLFWHFMQSVYISFIATVFPKAVASISGINAHWHTAQIVQEQIEEHDNSPDLGLIKRAGEDLIHAAPSHKAQVLTNLLLKSTLCHSFIAIQSKG